jgi:hypothetical protein
MFINEITFFVTISRDLKFCTSEVVRDMINHTLYNTIKQVIRIYPVAFQPYNVSWMGSLNHCRQT